MRGIHPVFNVSLLQAAPPDPIPGRVHPQPLPVVVESQEEYEVDKILNSHFYRRQLQYLVHWKGYSNRNNTWEPASNLSHAQTEVKKFHRENPNAPQRLAASLFFGTAMVHTRTAHRDGRETGGLGHGSTRTLSIGGG
jgi:hypothetical protein